MTKSLICIGKIALDPLIKKQRARKTPPFARRAPLASADPRGAARRADHMPVAPTPYAHPGEAQARFERAGKGWGSAGVGGAPS